MIAPTAKASSLPDDLKDEWAEMMANKFPMTEFEASAYIQKKWGHKVSVAYGDKDGKKRLRITWTVQIAQVMPQQQYNHYSGQISTYTTTTTCPQYNEVILEQDDFKPKIIDEKLKDV